MPAELSRRTLHSKTLDIGLGPEHAHHLSRQRQVIDKAVATRTLGLEGQLHLREEGREVSPIARTIVVDELHISVVDLQLVEELLRQRRPVGLDEVVELHLTRIGHSLTIDVQLIGT